MKIELWFLVRCEFSVSDADQLVESLLCCIAVPKGLFGVQSSFSAALRVPSGFSDRRFETTPDLSFPKHVKLVLAKRYRLQAKGLGLATNKAFKRDSQRVASLV
ncbi:TPA: hypothetical protein ACX3DH_004580 [Vibrio parahaemolyticus]